MTLEDEVTGREGVATKGGGVFWKRVVWKNNTGPLLALYAKKRQALPKGRAVWYIGAG